MTTNRDIFKAKRDAEKSKLREKIPVGFSGLFRRAVRALGKSNLYCHHHQSEQECARRLKNYPSLDLARYRH